MEVRRQLCCVLPTTQTSADFFRLLLPFVATYCTYSRRTLSRDPRYSTTSWSELPTIGVLTLVDFYILFTFAFIATVTLEVAVVDWIDHGGGMSEKDDVAHALAYVTRMFGG